jgi:hypothetical protein
VPRLSNSREFIEEILAMLPQVKEQWISVL